MALPVLDTPTYDIVVPSTGESIKYRPFLVKEHKVLMTLSEADGTEISRVVKELIDVCTFNKLNVEKLSNFDVEFLFLNLRSKSIGENVDIVVNCPCGYKINHSINLNDVKVVKSEGFTNRIMIRTNVGVTMRYPTFEENVKILENIDNAEVFDIVAKCIDTIFTDKEVYDRSMFNEQEAQNFLSQLTKQEFEKIEDFFLKMPKVVQHVETVCPECKGTNRVEMKGLENFFV